MVSETTLLSYEFAQQHQVLVSEKCILVGPKASTEGLLEAQRKAAQTLSITCCHEAQFRQQLHEHYHHAVATAEQVAAGFNNTNDLHGLLKEVRHLPIDLLQQNGAALVIRMINGLIAEAIREGASDIHIQQGLDQVRVRLRRDGTLQSMINLASEMGPLLLSRIKIMARLNIAEKRAPQDGRMSVDLAGRQVDIRVSIIPCRGEERAVLRILDRHQRLMTLDDLGMESSLQGRLRSLVQRPHGILLVTGPTGSGKTTTLYACLQQLDHQSLNIMTIEDPVEYALPTISQTPVNDQTGMTFAKGLRAILRQDPDVILVGEIRDLETAKIAIQASLTGHLVLSTLHTNNAVSAITRLQDMGVPSYLLASSLIGVIGQRLVRRVCNQCRQQESNCESCGGTGFEGRIGLFEWLQMDQKLKQLVHAQASEQSLLQASPNMQGSMREDGQTKITKGLVDPLEVQRVSEL